MSSGGIGGQYIAVLTSKSGHGQDDSFEVYLELFLAANRGIYHRPNPASTFGFDGFL